MTGRPAGGRVVVLLGGPSAEHDVSVVSGWAIADALAAAGRSVERIFIDLAGGWWWLPASACQGRPAPGTFDDPRAVGGDGPWTPGGALDRLAARNLTPPEAPPQPEAPPPVVFVALHGPFGEDGTIQALLESAGLAYTGPGVAASAVGMDKILYKRLARGLDLPVVDWLEVTATAWVRDRAAVVADLEAFCRAAGDERLMVKPDRLGSSVGMTLAHDRAEWGPALEEAFRFDTLVLAERYLDHPREFEVAVVGNDPDRLEVFGPGEVFPGREFYDYVAKYADGASRTLPQANLPAELARQVRELALAAYRAIGCEGFARVDFMLSGDELYLNEINTVPGFTPISLFPQMAASGLGSFVAVCERIVELAVERHAARLRRALTAADLPR